MHAARAQTRPDEASDARRVIWRWLRAPKSAADAAHVCLSVPLTPCDRSKSAKFAQAACTKYRFAMFSRPRNVVRRAPPQSNT